jgi:hypothetical protein
MCGKKGEESRGFVVKPAGRKPFGRPRCRLEKLLKWTLKKLDGRVWAGLIWVKMWTTDRQL